MPVPSAPSPPPMPDSPLLHHLVTQFTVIKAQAQMIRRRMNEPEAPTDSLSASQERAFIAIDLAVDQAMTQLLIAARGNRMPLDPLQTSDDAA